MKIRFQNLEQEFDGRNGQVFTDNADVLRLLAEMKNVGPPIMFPFIADNGFSLTIGIKGDFGCVQHPRNDGLGPYMMAVDCKATAHCAGDMEFAVGGTLTPIDARYRISFDNIRRVVFDFLATGDRGTAVDWNEFA